MNLQMKSATKKNINPVIAKEIKYFLENKIPLTDDAFLSLDMKIKILEDKTKCEKTRAINTASIIKHGTTWVSPCPSSSFFVCHGER